MPNTIVAVPICVKEQGAINSRGGVDCPISPPPGHLKMHKKEAKKLHLIL